MKHLTPENLSLEALGLPKDDVTKRFFPEAREAAIVMMDQAPYYHMFPPEIQHMLVTMFCIGYMRKAAEHWRPW